MQYNIKQIISTGAKVAVHCPTEVEAKTVTDIMWDKKKNLTYLHRYGSDSAISIYGFGNTSFYNGEGYTIIPAFLFLQHNRAEKKPFAVKAETYELMQKYKDEVESIGWKDKYNDFSYHEWRNCPYLGFAHSEELYNDRQFTLCLTGDDNTFHLETQYNEAIEAAKAWFEPVEEEQDIYDAVADYRKDHPQNDTTEFSAMREDRDRFEKEAKQYKDLYETMQSECERLQSVVYKANNELRELRYKNQVFITAHKKLASETNTKLSASIMLLDAFDYQSTHRQKAFAVNAIRSSLQKWIDTEYREPDAFELPF